MAIAAGERCWRDSHVCGGESEARVGINIDTFLVVRRCHAMQRKFNEFNLARALGCSVFNSYLEYEQCNFWERHMSLPRQHAMEIRGSEHS